MSLEIVLRAAAAADLAAIRRLHAMSFAALARQEHSPAQIAAHAALIAAPEYATDVLRSHLMLALSAAGEIVGTAGWIAVPEEWRTARIRKVFVHPAWARRGIGTRILELCEQAARAEGFSRAEMGATLTGVAFYQRHGYAEFEPMDLPLANGEVLPIVRMAKLLSRPVF